jgi:serine/threonine protein kinase
VYKAKWKDSKTGLERLVAVKIVKEKLLARSDIIPRHVEEAAVMFPIRKEPNVVALLGWCNSTVIVDYIPHALDEFIFDTQVDISVQKALELALDAAKGLYQLHAAPGGPFAHADLQPRQFLLNTNGILLLNDFNRVRYTGPSLLKGEENLQCLFQNSVAKGKWRALEEYARQQLDEKLDIYSLALVLWSLRSRTKPYANIKKSTLYELVAKNQLRPPIEKMKDYPAEMQHLIIQAWDQNPSNRPSAKQMVDQIAKILHQYRIGRTTTIKVN